MWSCWWNINPIFWLLNPLPPGHKIPSPHLQLLPNVYLSWIEKIPSLSCNRILAILLDLFAKFPTIWLESSPLWTLGWEDKIDFIVFYISKVRNCFKGTCWQWIRTNWNLVKKWQEKGIKRERWRSVYALPHRLQNNAEHFCQSNFTLVTEVLLYKNNLFYKLAVKSLEKPTMNNWLLVILPLLSLFNPQFSD